MRCWLLTAILSVCLIGWGHLSRVEAQPLVPDPSMRLNAQRAYSHFMTSPYSYRTWSSASPGYGRLYVSPLVYDNRWVEPGYAQQRLTPAGYESFGYVPGGGTYQVTPYGAVYSFTPGYAYRHVEPEVLPRPLRR